MYSLIIEIKKNVTNEMLLNLCKIAEKAFSNRAGNVNHSSIDPYRFVFKDVEDKFGCLEAGMLEPEDKHDFLSQINSWPVRPGGQLFRPPLPPKQPSVSPVPVLFYNFPCSGINLKLILIIPFH